jgi:hypothetical protein
MSQVTSYVIPGAPLTMAVLKSTLDSLFAAAVSMNRGSGAPANPFEGMTWWDTTTTPVEIYKRYTVAAGWVSLL